MDRPRCALQLTAAMALGLMAFLAFAPGAAAATYTISLHTSASSYSATQPIVITGVVSPAPGANTGIIITIDNSAGSLADVNELNPNAATGAYNWTSYPGGNAAWTTGAFTVNATWGGDGTTASSVTTFFYSSTPTTTTSTSTITASTSTSAVTTPAPEFPSSAVAMVALAGVAIVAVLSRKVASAPGTIVRA